MSILARVATVVALAATTIAWQCNDSSSPNDWTLDPKTPANGLEGPSHIINNWAKLGHDTKDGDPSSSVSRKCDCGESNPEKWCTMTFNILFQALDKERLKLTLGSGAGAKTIYLTEGTYAPAAPRSSHDYTISVRGCTKDTPITASLTAGDKANLQSNAEISKGTGQCTDKDETNREKRTGILDAQGGKITGEP
ncbi:MAG: hypothetical protein M3068_03985 [Gemmatimonadota bacterium]|nr:hypothetical protein [Gemmatimonadota bacterium]